MGLDVKSEPGQEESKKMDVIEYDDPGFVSDIADRKSVQMLDYEADRENNVYQHVPPQQISQKQNDDDDQNKWYFLIQPTSI